MTNNNKKTKKIVTEVVFFSILAVLMALVIHTGISVFNGKTPSFFGFSFLRVETGSMEPNIPTHSVILVKNLSQDDVQNLAVGDVIVYYDNSLGVTITHRIVEIDTQNKIIVTRGDHNTREDEPISFSQVRSRYVYRFRVVTWLTSVLRNKFGFALVIIIPSLILIALYIVSIIKNSAKMSIKKQQEQEASKIDELKKQAVEEYLKNQESQFNNIESNDNNTDQKS